MGLFESFRALSDEQRAEFTSAALADETLLDAVATSAVQERMIVLAAMPGGAAAYNLPWAGRVTGPLDVPSLHAAFGRVLQRHEQLRRRFVHAGDRLLALDSDVSSCPPVHHEVTAAPGDRDRDAVRRAAADATAPFQVLGGPLCRLTTVTYASDDHLVLLAVHHAAADGWSLTLLYRDLSRAYADVRAGRAAPPPPAGNYERYVAGERRQRADGSRAAALQRWTARLRDAPAGVELPVDRPRPRTQDFDGANAERVLPAGTGEALRALARFSGATPYMVCLAAFALAVRRWTGDRDLVVGTPVLGRPSAEFDDVVGMFVNTIPLRLALGDTWRLVDTVELVRDVCLDAFEDQDVPLDAIVDGLGDRRDVSRPPFFQLSFAHTSAEDGAASPQFDGTAVRSIDVAGSSAKFELGLTVEEQADGGLRLVLEYATALFDPRSAERVLDVVEAVLTAAGTPAVDVRTIPFALPPAPTWSTDPLGWADPANVHELVAAAAARTPSARAITWAGEPYTYDRLITESHQLAVELVHRGVTVGTRVGIMLERTPRMLVAMLGVFAAGGSYVPLDPTYPAARLTFMLSDSRCVALVTDAARLPAELPPDVEVIDPADLRATPDDPLPAIAPRPADEAYVLYTSGSTGVPKGVSIPHRAVLRMVHGTWQIFGTECLRRSLATTSASFDVSTVELFPTLGLGGTVHLAPSLFDIPPADPRPTFTAGVPSLLAAALDSDTLDVRDMVVAAAGEPLRAELVARLRAAGAARVANLYGPSEDCTYSSAAFVADQDPLPPIGVSVPGSRCYLLDPDAFAVPLGAVGEMHLAGDGLADGYVRRPGLTATRFLPDPFAGSPGARMYRTGDLGRVRPDGLIEYHGRLDRQVKVNGMRIELGEVETALLGVEGVMRCAAVVQRGPDSARLGAVVESGPGMGIDTGAVRRTLAQTMPGHLVPTVLVEVDTIPALPNGKVDIDTVLTLLPAFGAPVPGIPTSDVDGPDGTAASALRRLWRTVLPGSDGHGDFFAEGGNSLSALRLALLVRDEFEVSFDLADVFAERTAEAMARLVAASADPAQSLPIAATTPAHLPLSREQFRIWFVEQVDDPGAAYVVPMGWVLSGPLDAAALATAVEALQQRHAALRQRLDEVDGEPVTIDGGTIPLVHVPATDDPVAQFARFAGTALPLDGGALFAAELARLGDDRHLLMIKAHHLVVDGWSVGILEQDLGRLYADAAAGAPAGDAGQAAGYADHVAAETARLGDPRIRAGVQVWADLLADAPTVLRLTDAPDRERTLRGTSCRFPLAAGAAAALVQLAAAHDLTPFMASSFVFGLTLMQTADVDDVLFGSPVSGRYDRSLERTVGMFVNTIVLRLDARGNPPVEELLARYRRFGDAAYRHQDVAFDLVVEAVGPQRSAAHNPLFQVLFSYDFGFGGGLDMPGLHVHPLDEPGTTSKFDLFATVGGDDAPFDHLVLEYSSDLFTPADADAFVRRFEALAVSVAGTATGAVSGHLSAAGPGERTR